MSRRGPPPRTVRRYPFQGGLNQITPHLMLKPGEAFAAQNFEVTIGGGYRRCDGYERYDGRSPLPSAATYERIAFGSGNYAFAANDVITGGTSGATAVVVLTPTLSSGAFGSGNAVGQLSFTSRSGTFQLGENLLVGGVVRAVTTGTTFAGTVNDADRKACLRGAQAYYRSLILAVPGSGSILGVWTYNGSVYALRNNVGGTAAVLFVATSGGWSAVTLGSFIRFTNGVGQINAGDTITGGTSGATATVQRVNIGSGNWTGPTFAAGRLAITAIVGTFQNAEALKVGGVTKATSVGLNATNVLSPGGRFEFVNFNFYASSNFYRMYACDGVNRAWEFDGTIFCFIETGMTVDTPTHIAAHRGYLFLAFPGGSLQNSGTADPMTWSPRQGAQDIGLGEDITNILSVKDQVLAVWGLHFIALLYGSSNATWQLVKHAGKVGAVAYSAGEIVGRTLFVDRRGVFDLDTANAVNEDSADMALTRKVKPFLVGKTAAGVQVIGVVISLDRSQIRIIYNDATALVGTFVGGHVDGWMPMIYAHQFVCMCNGESASGTEALFAGDANGMVYKLNSGASFDGTAVQSVLRLPFWDCAAPMVHKHFVSYQIQTDSPQPITIGLLTEFDYGAEQSAVYNPINVTGAGGAWDAANWDNFVWDGVLVSTPQAQIEGWGLNMSPILYHNDDIDAPFSLQAAQITFVAHGQQL